MRPCWPGIDRFARDNFRYREQKICASSRRREAFGAVVVHVRDGVVDLQTIGFRDGWYWAGVAKFLRRRARNATGPGAARAGVLPLVAGVFLVWTCVTAPVASAQSRPGELASLVAQPRDKEMQFVWEPPTDDGGSPITGYDVRRDQWDEDQLAEWVFQEWESLPGTARSHLPTGLSNVGSYEFQVRGRVKPVASELNSGPVFTGLRDGRFAGGTKFGRGQACISTLLGLHRLRRADEPA